MLEYVKIVNLVVADYVLDSKIKHTSKTISADLPSVLRCQANLDAKSIAKKYRKGKRKNPEAKVPILKKPVAIWNNQNYAIQETHISLPIWLNGKSKRIEIKALTGDYEKNLLQNKLGTLRITKKNHKYIAQIAIKVPKKESSGDKVMGIDLGLKIPAVAIVDSTVKFCGNGRENKFVRRKFKSLRKKLGELKKPKAIKHLNNKEQCWMRDKDHLVSRQLVNFAVKNNVSTIKLEKLSGIRTTRTSRKNNLHTWSFYRLAQYIEYKAKLEGIKVEYINPMYTSQKCPSCGILNKAEDRKYQCGCGYEKHRDIVGAINISTLAVGERLSA